MAPALLAASLPVSGRGRGARHPARDLAPRQVARRVPCRRLGQLPLPATPTPHRWLCPKYPPLPAVHPRETRLGAGAGAAATAFERLGLAATAAALAGALAAAVVAVYAGVLGLRATWLFLHLQALGPGSRGYARAKAAAWRERGRLLALAARLRAAGARWGTALTNPGVEAATAGLALAAAAGLSRWWAGGGGGTAAAGAAAAVVAAASGAVVVGCLAAGAALWGGVGADRRDTVAERRLEDAALAALHRGSHHCAWMPDPYDTDGKLSNDLKAELNAVLAAGAAEAARGGGGWGTGGSLARASALVLDARSAQTSEALLRVGFNPSRVRAPNAFPHVAAALRARGLRAWVGDVGDFLLSRDPAAEPFVFVDLDYCGGPLQRLPHLRALFERHVIADGGLLSVAFSFNGVGPGEDAVDVTATAIEEAARDCGYVAERWRYHGRATWAPHMLCCTYRIYARG